MKIRSLLVLSILIAATAAYSLSQDEISAASDCYQTCQNSMKIAMVSGTTGIPYEFSCVYAIGSGRCEFFVVTPDRAAALIAKGEGDYAPSQAQPRWETPSYDEAAGGEYDGGNAPTVADAPKMPPAMDVEEVESGTLSLVDESANATEAGGAPKPIEGAPAVAAQKPILAKNTIEIEGRPYRGGENAPVVMVGFSEYLCPYCKRAEPTIAQLEAKYGNKLKYVPMQFIVHQQARLGAEAAECAHAQGKFFEMHDLLFSEQKVDRTSIGNYARQIELNLDDFNKCLDLGEKKSEVIRQENLGKDLGVGGTPTFFINSKKLVGALSYEEFAKIIDAQLSG